MYLHVIAPLLQVYLYVTLKGPSPPVHPALMALSQQKSCFLQQLQGIAGIHGHIILSIIEILQMY